MSSHTKNSPVRNSEALSPRKSANTLSQNRASTEDTAHLPHWGNVPISANYGDMVARLNGRSPQLNELIEKAHRRPTLTLHGELEESVVGAEHIESKATHAEGSANRSSRKRSAPAVIVDVDVDVAEYVASNTTKARNRNHPVDVDLFDADEPDSSGKSLTGKGQENIDSELAQIWKATFGDEYELSQALSDTLAGYERSDGSLLSLADETLSSSISGAESTGSTNAYANATDIVTTKPDLSHFDEEEQALILRAKQEMLETARRRADQVEAANAKVAKAEEALKPSTATSAGLEKTHQKSLRAATKRDMQRQEAKRRELSRVETARADAQRMETQRIKRARDEAERLEAARAEAARIEAVRADAQERADALQIEARLVEAKNLDVRRAQATKAKASVTHFKPQPTKSNKLFGHVDLDLELGEASQTDAERLSSELAKAEAAQVEEEHLQALQVERERVEAARSAALRAEAQKAEALRAREKRAVAHRAKAKRAEAKRAEAKRAEAKRAEAKRAEAKRAEAKRAEAKRAEAKRAEAKRAEAKRAEAKRAEAKRAEAKRAEAKRAEAKRAEASRAETKRAEAKRAEAKRAEARRVQMAEADARNTLANPVEVERATAILADSQRIDNTKVKATWVATPPTVARAEDLISADAKLAAIERANEQRANSIAAEAKRAERARAIAKRAEDLIRNKAKRATGLEIDRINTANVDSKISAFGHLDDSVLSQHSSAREAAPTSQLFTPQLDDEVDVVWLDETSQITAVDIVLPPNTGQSLREAEDWTDDTSALDDTATSPLVVEESDYFDQSLAHLGGLHEDDFDDTAGNNVPASSYASTRRGWVVRTLVSFSKMLKSAIVTPANWWKARKNKQ